MPAFLFLAADGSLTTCTRVDAHAWFNYPFLTQKERDNETGLDYFLARYYSSSQGRFTSLDPENYQARLDPTDPQSWNAYSYVNNNPVRRVDLDGRGFWEKLKNAFNGYGWRSNAEVQQLEDKWRNWLREKEGENGGNLISGCPQNCHRIDINSLSRNDVFHYAADLKFAIEHGTAIRYTQDEVNNMQGVSPPAMAAPTINFSPTQLQKKFKCSGDFGVKGNYNPSNASQFQQSMESHISDPATKAISGTFRGEQVTHYVNPNTGLNVMKDAAGNFVSGWKLSPAQLSHVLTTGKL